MILIKTCQPFSPAICIWSAILLDFFYFVLSFYAKRKDERKGAGNANFRLNGRLQRWPYWRNHLAWSSRNFRFALAPWFRILYHIKIMTFGFKKASENFGIKRLFKSLLRRHAESNTVWVIRHLAKNELYCVGNLKNVKLNPEYSGWGCLFLWFISFGQAKEMNT